MKKRVLATLLAFALTFALFEAPAFAAGAFSDVKDPATERSVEVLRLMGVVAGNGNGTFRPDSYLTRAEFCKMAIVLEGVEDQVARYKNRTIFPDVRATTWAAGYVNLAANYSVGDGTKLIRGLPDGRFAPAGKITYGQAVTILMRMLGYSDADVGAVWPQGYMALAEEKGVSLKLKAASKITRAQAAELFVAMLGAEGKKGAYKTLGSETTLLSVDASKGVLRTADGDVAMAKPKASTALAGLKGRVVYDGENKKALTFLPSTSMGGGAISNAAVIVSADGSTAGFDALSGDAKDYAIYRNGVKASAGDLRQYDVATYSAASNTIEVCDTRVSAYYEDCAPSPSAPATVTVLGGTVFTALPTAQQSLARFKPGSRVVLLLTAGGEVAGAVESGAQGNALGIVNAKGKVRLLSGSDLIGPELKLENGADASGMVGQVVRVSQPGRGAVTLTRQSGVVNGALDVKARTLGTWELADDAAVFLNGEASSLSKLGAARYEQKDVAYAHANAANKIDLIAIAEEPGDTFYGRAVLSEGTKSLAPFGSMDITLLSVEYGNGKASTKVESAFSVSSGDYVEAKLSGDGGHYVSVTALTGIANVPATAWIGTGAVVANGQTYTVDSSVPCWNKDTGRWFGSLDLAMAYGGAMTLYVKDGAVRVIEVSG